MRIEWVHELHQRFNTDPGDCDYEFADLEKSSKYYEDAVWAKNLGIYPSGYSWPLTVFITFEESPT